ncbi:hypothetical protein [Actinomadura hibisca]|uniref:hypothetical protein n=1 Tax=Actinomadura hibisca TaxID=68565 RepID=UPI00082CD730|nr:hypothetical protein [Actinomadura hibisca]
MAMAKKGTRLITVDGIGYRWKVRRRPTHSQSCYGEPLSFVVEAAEEPGALLVVSLPYAHPGSAWQPAAVVLPSTVAQAVRTARREGWRPEGRGPVFSLKLAESDVALVI